MLFDITDERFEYARKLKAVMVELRAAGERLGKLEIGKKQAIIQEDYSKAKKKKAQMDDYRKEVYRALEVDNLLEEKGVSCIHNSCIHNRRLMFILPL